MLEASSGHLKFLHHQSPLLLAEQLFPLFLPTAPLLFLFLIARRQIESRSKAKHLD
jgi:hypothetical protein